MITFNQQAHFKKIRFMFVIGKSMSASDSDFKRCAGTGHGSIVKVHVQWRSTHWTGAAD